MFSDIRTILFIFKWKNYQKDVNSRASKSAIGRELNIFSLSMVSHMYSFIEMFCYVDVPKHRSCFN